MFSLLLTLVAFFSLVYQAPSVPVSAPKASTITNAKDQAYFSYPANEYEYSLRRDALKEAAANYGGERIQLTEAEVVVDHYLKLLKWREYQNTKDTGFPPLRPIEETMNATLQSELYSVMKRLPKGGNVHSHENHQLSKRTLLDIVWTSADFENLWILPEDHPTSPWTLDFFINPPLGEGWIRVSGDPYYTKETILKHQTLIGIMDEEAHRYPSDSQIRWRNINPLWMRGSTQLVANINIKERYLEALLRDLLLEGVQYYEARKNFGPAEWLYRLDPSATDTFGKVLLDNTGELEINITLQLIERLKLEFPQFIGFRRIVYSHRQSDFGSIEEDVARVKYLYSLFPQHIAGYDMVGEEDAGNSHLYYVDKLLELYDPDSGMSSLPLYFHAGESNFPGDLITSSNDIDPVATGENIFDARLLSSRRLGHALSILKNPYLMEVLKDNDIAVEVCPISGQILGFAPDLRNMPGMFYHLSGVPIVIGSDDPGTFGYDHFTIDWYQIYLAWGMDLADLKKLAHNSLNYSSLSGPEKISAIEKWTTEWDRFSATVRDEICAMDFTSSSPIFGKLLPKEGSLSGSTVVHVYGRNFEAAICSTVVCRFGDVVSETQPAIYIDSFRITCHSPIIEAQDEVTVPVSVSFDNGLTFLDIGSNFTYKY